MTDPFLGEIRMFGGSFAPVHWTFCDGQLLSISQNTALFSLLGTAYGGDGRVSFALPDLRGRIPVNWSNGGNSLSPRPLGIKFGTETVPLSVSDIPTHNHALRASMSTATSSNPGNDVLASHGTDDFPYAEAPNDPSHYQTMNSKTVANAGGSEPHYNMMPYCCINFIIALVGTYPSRP